MHTPFLVLPVKTRGSLPARSLVLLCCGGRRTGRPKGLLLPVRPVLPGPLTFPTASPGPLVPCVAPALATCSSRVVDGEREQRGLRHPARPARPAGLGVP